MGRTARLYHYGRSFSKTMLGMARRVKGFVDRHMDGTIDSEIGVAP